MFGPNALRIGLCAIVLPHAKRFALMLVVDMICKLRRHLRALDGEGVTVT